MKRIYLDHHATTPLDPEACEAMLPYLRERYGNPSSRQHEPGRQAMRAVEAAREQVARFVGADPREVVFTSGATEANNLAIKGAASALVRKGTLVTPQTEHKSVLDVCRRLERDGWKTKYLRPDRDGLVDPAAVTASVGAGPTIVSVMWANNEIGTIQPIRRLAAAARAAGAVFHTDAVQAAGRVPLDFHGVGADLLTLSAHKMYGPKGVGALIVRKRGNPLRILPLFDGGAQEGGLRSGTVNVPAIVGFAAACRVADRRMGEDARREAALRDRLIGLIVSRIDGVRINGGLEHRLSNNLNVSFEGILAKDLLPALKPLALSSGSACLSSSPEPSYVLRAIGVPEPLRHASLRVGIGRGNTRADIDRAAEWIVRAVKRLRKSGGYCPRTGGVIQ